MAYTISYATPAVAFSVTKETAGEAFEMAMDYINQGYATIKLGQGHHLRPARNPQGLGERRGTGVDRFPKSGRPPRARTAPPFA
jgi:hypothetical protein